MLKQLLAESLIVLSGTVFLVALAATVGIPGDDRDPAQAVATKKQSGHATPVCTWSPYPTLRAATVRERLLLRCASSASGHAPPFGCGSPASGMSYFLSRPRGSFVEEWEQ